MWRRQKRPAPFFKQHMPLDAVTGQHAPIGETAGPPTYVAMMQVKEEDTHDNYVVCRGFWPGHKKFFDTINVAKPYGQRGTFPYSVGEVHPALLAVTRIGITPGVAKTSTGHPADLDEEIEILKDDDEVVIEWMFLGGVGGSGVQIIRFTIVELQCYACSEDFVDPEFLYQTVATGQVRAWPPGTSLASVPDSFMSTVTFPTTGDQSVRCVSLMDLAGCWLNGPEDELLWRTGWAVYLDAERGLGCEYGEIVDQGSDGDAIVPRWEIMSLCPREATCGSEYGT